METNIAEKGHSRVIEVEKKGKSGRGNHSIYLPITKVQYESIIGDSVKYRSFVSESIYNYIELFPAEILSGYTLDDKDESKKLGIKIRRIKIKGTSERYSIYPSYILPYMVSETSEEVSNAMLLLHYGVPYWLVSQILGKNDSYWERIECSIGRKSIVGTSVYNTNNLPKNYVADEKISFWNNQEVYIGMTSSEECVLGLSVSKTSDEAGLKEAYGVFKAEALQIRPNFSPESVNTDAWAATRKVWKELFPKMTLLLCFLHSVLKIRNIATKKCEQAPIIITQMWEAYHAKDEVEFCDKLFDLQQYANDEVENDKIKDAIGKVVKKIGDFAVAYRLDSPYRTSNMVDRQMKFLDRLLFKRQYFHGDLQTVEDKLRAWALIHNFAHFCPRTKQYKLKQYNSSTSRVEQMNGFKYHHNWLQNLIIAGSMNGNKYNPTIR